MAKHWITNRGLRRLAALLALALACLPAWAEYWEAPEILAQDGRFPSLFSTQGGPILIWEESQSTGETGSARIRFARFEGGSWRRGSVSDSSYAFTSTGAPPILYSAAQARDGTIAVAIAATTTRIELWLCRDGRSFSQAGRLETEIASVAPRVYPSASGGWLLFATQGKAATEASATDAAAGGQPSSLGIYVAHSADGSSWSPFAPLIGEGEGLPMNFAPFAAPLGSKDIVVFQTFILGEGEQSSRYALMAKLSSDGGASWGAARNLSDFDADAKGYDNQGAQLLRSGGRLYLAWERRRLKATQTQVWSARIEDSGSVDARSAGVAQGTSGSFMLSHLFEGTSGPELIAREDKLKANRVLLSSLKAGAWESEDAELADRGGQAGQNLVTFARAALSRGRIFAAWQLDSGDRSRILAMVPDTSAAAPGLAPQNFSLGRRSRAEEAQVRLLLPADASGIKDFAYLWKKTPDSGEKGGSAAPPAPSVAELWKSGQKRDAAQNSLSLPATMDGEWSLWASVEDAAGNRSPVSALGFYRKRVPPPAPIILSPDLDDKGFLAASSFTLRWIPPEADDIAGYTWDLAYAGALESARQSARALGAAGGAKTATEAAPAASVPGLSAYESELVRAASLKLPPPSVRGTDTSYSVDNIDNGYYLFSVSAIDTTGNISGAATILLRSDKFKPYTIVERSEGARDELGRNVMRIIGRGFLADGRIERVVLDRNGREPYDIDKRLALGDFRIDSDRGLSGLTIEDAQAGSYRIGLYHSTRGWYWTSPIVAIDSSGTIKYGVNVDYKPRLSFFSGNLHAFTIYDAIVLMAMLFAALGILLASRKAVAVAREAELVRREATALVTGGPMPQIESKRKARELKRRGAGLRAKFTLIIAFLVILVVLLLAGFLGYNMIRRTSEDLAKGLDQRSRVLLESAAQGGRFFMGKEDAITQLSFLPSQTKAMEGATYITISGESSDPKVAAGDVVYATNDERIAAKLESATLGPGGALVLGQSAFKAAKGGPDGDPLAPLVAAKAAELRDKARSAIAGELEIKSKLAQEKAALGKGAAASQRKSEINAELDQVDVRIREKLRMLSDAEVGSLPEFDPTVLGGMKASYLYYKPILEYRPSDDLLYRGLVRLEVSTRQISEEVRSATFDLIRLTLIIAAIALGIGIVGAFVLSAAIVRPIRKLVAQIGRIRDTEDKESLEGSRIEVRSRDELYDLADTVNQMTEGLVSAAKAAKELTIGKGIQKMFIPLDSAKGSRAKLSTGRRDEKDFEIYGYYEGAKGVSGDYWDFQSINSRYHYFIKCDISGKGVSAALIMVQVATIVITYFNAWKRAMPKSIDLTDLAYRVNDFLEERQFVGRFAAFTVGVWDSQEGVAYLCEAGDRKLHVWDEAKRKLVEELLPDSPAAGPLASILVQMKNPFTQVTRRLGHGDALMLYTDGIEEAKRHFRDAEFKVIECESVPKDQVHENHSGGQDNEEFGYDRITAVLEAVASKGGYRLVKHHNPVPDELLSFDFSSCAGTLEEKVLALVSVEKVFRMYKDPKATEKDAILVDEKIDAFLKEHFDQYRLYCSNQGEHIDPSKENPGYLLYKGLREDSQYDDLTILGIRRK